MFRSLRSGGGPAPVRRLTVILDHVAPGDTGDYRREIENYRLDMEGALQGLAFDDVEFITDHSDLPSRLHARRPEFVLHLAEYGFKGSRSLFCCQIPALLEQAAIPFSNAGAAGMVLSSDKHLIHDVLRAAGRPVPDEVLLHRDDVLAGRAVVPRDFTFPAFLKTRLNGGSVGIAGPQNIVERADLVRERLREVLARFTPDDVRDENMDEWLLQEFLPGPEFSVAIVGNGAGRDVLPVGQLAARTPYLTYDTGAEVLEATDEDGAAPERYLPAALSTDETHDLEAYALVAWDLLACRDYARFDFRRDRSGVLKLIDANSLPGIYRGSAFVAMAAMRNQSFDELWHEILHASFERCFAGA